MHAGPALVGRAHRQAEPPVFADPLPQPLGALAPRVAGNRLVRVDDRGAERAPFAQRDRDRGGPRERLVRDAGEGRLLRVARRRCHGERPLPAPGEDEREAEQRGGAHQ